ncbi:thioredoxin domain-containing protein [Fodinibius sp. Rm-B-1B1-1]|uniref:thioredoxin domain-containing protein n=1 Tax=Fodinibius alkaliphilus TaxID=3140241 RepID=UPI003159CA82
MADSSQHSQNRLANESSPYLLQHADNPVDWYPWGEEAFQKAEKEDKPVLVSIGYATCHWCHVMAHESFEDEQIAELMNRAFVNIKVDREERPDIDNTYMLVCQMLTGSGGWPLNVFLTPDKKPFYAATYIPKVGRQGRPGMRELIPWMSQLWENKRDKIINSTDEIVTAFQKSNDFEITDDLDDTLLDEAYNQYEQQFDNQYGGFGSSPKFPSPHNLMLLLRYADQNPDSKALPMVEQTLTKMRMGGLFDQVGGGFHRYSTDREWLVPHFEKMLYDQAMMLMAYTEGWQLTGNELFKQTVDEVCEYLTRKMRDKDGGFYSAEDADSEGEEGKFYVWSIDEVREVLSMTEAELAIGVFNMTEEGNYRDEASGQRTGKNILHLQKPIQALADERDMDVEAVQSEVKSIKKKLLEVRQDRVHPLLDDKILTDWNGLMIAALAKAGAVLGNEDYLQQAEECWSFIADEMLTDNGRLMHRYRNGDVAINGHADDYAFVIWGLLELYEATLDTEYLEQAILLNEQFIDEFWDADDGGFYFTSETAEELLGRKKEIYDGAMPSGNSIAVMNLLRLGRITGRTEWEQMAEDALKLFGNSIKQAPTSFGVALQAVDFMYGNSQEVILAGKLGDSQTDELVDILRSRFLPRTVVIFNDSEDGMINSLVPYLADFGMKDGKPTAYVCQNYACELPTHDPQQMTDLLSRS